MAFDRSITFQRILRRGAQLTRSHAPGLFQHIAANRFLRAAYRRVASPRVTSAVAYVNPPVVPAATTAPATSTPSDLADYLKLEVAKWAPGKRIDA